MAMKSKDKRLVWIAFFGVLVAAIGIFTTVNWNWCTGSVCGDHNTVTPYQAPAATASQTPGGLSSSPRP